MTRRWLTKALAKKKKIFLAKKKRFKNIFYLPAHREHRCNCCLSVASSSSWRSIDFLKNFPNFLWIRHSGSTSVSGLLSGVRLRLAKKSESRWVRKLPDKKSKSIWSCTSEKQVMMILWRQSWFCLERNLKEELSLELKF